MLLAFEALSLGGEGGVVLEDARGPVVGHGGHVGLVWEGQGAAAVDQQVGRVFAAEHLGQLCGGDGAHHAVVEVEPAAGEEEGG